VSFFGNLGYELDLKHLLPTEEKEIMHQIEFYKTYRRIFQFGSFARLYAPEGVGWQVSGGNTCLAGLFHKLVHAAPGYEQLRLLDLEADKQYQLTSREQLLRVGMFGGLVKHIAPVELNPNGLVLRTADRLYPMPDGVEKITATGSALMAGVMLSPRFQGTGYNKDGRNQGDFCSNVYVVEKK
jgi:alpha-galactosidase